MIRDSKQRVLEVVAATPEMDNNVSSAKKITGIKL